MDEYFPGFRLVGETVVLLNAEHGRTTVVVPAADITIGAGDFIGIQHTGTSNDGPVLCKEDATSEWRISVIDVNTNLWINSSESHTFSGMALWKHNMVCDIEAVFSVPQTVPAPVNMVKASTLRTGRHVYTAEVTNGVSAQNMSGNVTFLYRVRDFGLVLPNSVPILPASAVNDKLAVEANTVAHFLWKIRTGTQVVAIWNQTEIRENFSQVCPEQFSDLADCQDARLQFAYTTHRFPYIGEQDVTTIKFNASNPISSQTVIYDIVAQIPIQNLSLVVPDPAPFRPNNSVSFSARVGAGSHITFTWRVGDGSSFSTDTEETEVTASAPGLHEVLVSAENGLGSLRAGGTLTLIAEADPRNLRIVAAQSVVAGRVATVLASLEINQFSMLSFHFDLGDGSSVQRQDRVETLRTTSTANEAVLHTYSFSDDHLETEQVMVTVIVVDSLLWDSATSALQGQDGVVTGNVTILVVRPIQSAQVSITNSSAVFTVGSTVTFAAVQTGGTGPMSYTWVFGDGSAPEMTPDSTTEHVFAAAGTYAVSVEISNGASSATDSAEVVVEAVIRNLVLTYDGPTLVGRPTTLSAELTAGSAVWFEFHTGDGATSPFQNQPTYTHQYTSVGRFNATVRAFNNVSEAFDSHWVDIVDEETMLILGVDFPACVATGEEAVFRASVLHLNASALHFDWTFSDGASASGLGMTETRHVFGTQGSHTVDLSVWETVSVTETESRNRSNSFQAAVCVQERISGVRVWTNSPLAVRGGEASTVHLNVTLTVDTGSDYSVTWRFGSSSETRNILFVPTITYTETGTHQLTVIVENQINRVEVTRTVHVQEVIEGLRVSHDSGAAHFSTSETIQFAAHVLHGSPVRFTWNFYKVSDSTIAHTDGGNSTLFRTQTPGAYRLQVTASNNVSSETYNGDLNVLDPIIGLRVTSSSVFAPTGGTIGFMAEIDQGSSPVFTWTLCLGNRCRELSVDPNPTQTRHTFDSEGTYDVKIRAANLVSVSTANATVTVQDVVQGAAVEVNSPRLIISRYVVQGSNVSLSGTANSGSQVEYRWDLTTPSGDVLETEGQILSTVLSQSGLYSFLLNASNQVSHEATFYEIEAVDPVESVTVISLDGSRGNLGDVLHFEARTGNLQYPPTLYRWDIHNIETGTLMLSWETTVLRTQYFFAEYGTFTVSTEARNQVSSNRNETRVTIAEDVGTLEIVIEGQTTRFVRKGTPVVFRGVFERGSSTRFEWQFPDSDPPRVYSTQQVSHVFSRVGDFKVMLVVTNSVSSNSTFLIVSSEETISNLTLAPNTTLTPLSEPVLFVASTTSGSNLTYFWNFGDGEIGEFSRTVKHAFAYVANFTVSVRVRNDVSEATANAVIVVQEKIRDLRMINCCQDTVATGTDFLFDASVQSGSSVSYQWTLTLPDKTKPPVVRHTKTFTFRLSDPGQHSVHLQAKNALGSVDTSQILNVEDKILAVSIRGPEATYSGKTEIFFANVTGGTNVQCMWYLKLNGVWKLNATSCAILVVAPEEEDLFLKIVVENSVSNFTEILHVPVTVLRCPAPRLEPIGGTNRSELRSHSLHMEVSVKANCSRYRLHYLWEVYEDECQKLQDRTTSLPLRFIDTSTPTLVLPEKHLSYGLHCAKFTASYATTPMDVFVKVNLHILKSSLRAIINGGSERRYSRLQEILLDGSNSYDPDGMCADDPCTPLQYNWTCYELVRASESDNEARHNVPLQRKRTSHCAQTASNATKKNSLHFQKCSSIFSGTLHQRRKVEVTNLFCLLYE